MGQLVPLPAEIQVVAPGQWDHRRSAPRYQCGLATLAQVAVDASLELHRGWVLNLSTRGAGLLLAQALPLETFIVLHVRSTAGDRRYELPGRVIHATTQVGGDWLVGCEFADVLSAEDLDALL